MHRQRHRQRHMRRQRHGHMRGQRHGQTQTQMCGRGSGRGSGRGIGRDRGGQGQRHWHRRILGTTGAREGGDRGGKQRHRQRDEAQVSRGLQWGGGGGHSVSRTIGIYKSWHNKTLAISQK